MKIEYIPQDEFKAITKAAHKGGWAERAVRPVTVLDTNLARSNCIFADGGYIVVDDSCHPSRVTVLRIDEGGFVSEIKEIE